MLPNGQCYSSGSADLYMRLWATEHPIWGIHSILPACIWSFSRVVRSDGNHIVKGVEQLPQSSCPSSVLPKMAHPTCSCSFLRGPSAAPAITDTCARCAQGSQANGAPGMGNARMAWRAVESADAWRVSMAQPAKCVKWDDTELTANQVTLKAIAACLCHPACKGRKVVTSQERWWEARNVPRPRDRQMAGRPPREGQWE